MSRSPSGGSRPFEAEHEPDIVPDDVPVASGSVLVPYEATPPPSVAETTVNTIAGVIWPVMIVLAITGVLGWWPAILTAIVMSTVLGNVGGHLKSRRKALGPGRSIPPDDQNTLR